MTSRAARRARARELGVEPNEIPRRPSVPESSTGETSKTSPVRIAAFIGIAAIVLAAGLYYASNFMFSGGPGPANPGIANASGMIAPASGTIDLGISMAGFDPSKIVAKPGQVLTFNWWTTDAAPHLANGVHTLISDSMNLHLSLKAQSKETIQITAPMQPGDYDFWCDSCCGGKDSPDMHGTVEVKAA